MARNKMSQDFKLKTITDFSMQLSGVEWVESLPVYTPQDRRMKRVLLNTCSSCHPLNFVLQHRFDAQGWGVILDLMAKTTTGSFYVPPGSPIRSPLLRSYKEEMLGYLARVRGPGPSPMKWKPLPRPRGESAQIVVTEFDASPSGTPRYVMTYDGSDWSEGTPSTQDGKEVHCVALDREGYVWFSDDKSHERTIGKLDPRTGRVTDYRMAIGNDETIESHGINVDPAGKVWFTNMTEGTLTSFDPKSEQFRSYPRPSSMPEMVGTHMDVDAQGNVWASFRDGNGGAYKLDPKTGQYTQYKSPTPGGAPHGLDVDSKGNVWYTKFWADTVAHIDTRTGKVTEVFLGHLDYIGKDKISEKDIEIGENFEKDSGGAGSGVPLYRKAPRRLGTDRRGDTVWVSEYWASTLAKIDINTRKVTEYPLLYDGSHPYDAAVDKNHMVWVNMLNSDRFAKFNPFTEKFTEYPVPSLGTGTRNIWVDDREDPPIIWLPLNRVNKIARIQFRSAPTSK